MIGVGWLKEHNCVWSFGSSRLSIDGQQYESMTRRGTPRCRRVYTLHDDRRVHSSQIPSGCTGEINNSDYEGKGHRSDD